MDLRAETYSVRAEFARRAALDQRDRDRANEEHRRRLQKEREETIKEREALEFFEAVLATPAQIEAFSIKLDRYDTATVEALMNNEVQLQEVRKQVEKMLLEAHVLPDGRRVFRTRDGKQVFDENGKEIGPDTIRPDMIDPNKTAWEDYRAVVEREAKLREERTELQDYQNKLDDARTRVKEGNLSENELDRMDKDLEKSMPRAVRDIVERNDAQRQQIGKDAPSQEITDLVPDSPPKSDRRGVSAAPQGPGRG